MFKFALFNNLPIFVKQLIDMTTTDLKSIIPNYCDTITTKAVAALLGISTGKAYKLCCEAEAEGWLFKFGYKCRTGVTLPPDDSSRRTTSLIWQNVKEN